MIAKLLGKPFLHPPLRRDGAHEWDAYAGDDSV